MLAHMHQRVRAKRVAQPEIEGQIVVRRDQIGRMIGVSRVDVIAPCGLHPDDDVAVFQNR